MLSYTNPREVAFKQAQETIKSQAESARLFRKGVPVVLKLQLPLTPDLDARAVDTPGYSIAAYDETRKLQLQIHRESDSAGEFYSSCSVENLKHIANSITANGTGRGEAHYKGGKFKRHIRGYMEASLIRRDCLRLYIDRIYPQQPW